MARTYAEGTLFRGILMVDYLDQFGDVTKSTLEVFGPYTKVGTAKSVLTNKAKWMLDENELSRREGRPLEYRVITVAQYCKPEWKSL